MVCVTYCMYTRKDILKFVFDVFDKDGSGTIDEKEFIHLCNTVNNAAPLFPGNFAEAISQFDTNDDGLIDFNEFMELDKRYPLVLFPAFRLQDRMTKKVRRLEAASSTSVTDGRTGLDNVYLTHNPTNNPPADSGREGVGEGT